MIAPRAFPMPGLLGQPMTQGFTPVVFNETSLDRLSGINPQLRALMLETERRAANAGINFEISEGMRSREAQAEHVAAGRSQTMNSRHLTGNAVDIYRQNPDGSANYEFNDYKPINEIATTVAAEMGIPDYVWGGDWQTLRDGVHFQVGGPAQGGNPVMASGSGNETMTGGQGGDRMATQGLLSAPQEPARRPSIWDRLEGVPILGGLADPDRRARLAIGLGGMSLNPNQMLMAMNAQGIQDRAQERETTGRMNQTIAYLQSVGRDDLVALVQAGMDPGSALQASQPENLSPLEQAQLEQIQLETEQMRTAVPAGPDLPADFESLMLRAREMGLVPGSPDYIAFMASNGAAPEPVAPPSLIEPEGATDLRVRWEALTPVKQFQQVSGAYQSARRNAELGASGNSSADLALVYNMMNILDPGASVMEGDYKNASAAPGVVAAISSALAQAQGAGLTDERRADIMAQIEAAYKSKWQGYTQTANQYEDTATRQGYDPQATITEYRPQLPNGGSIRGAPGGPIAASPTPATEASPAPAAVGGQQPPATSQSMPLTFAGSEEAMALAATMGITIDELWSRMPPEGRSAWLD